MQRKKCPICGRTIANLRDKCQVCRLKFLEGLEKSNSTQRNNRIKIGFLLGAIVFVIIGSLVFSSKIAKENMNSSFRICLDNQEKISKALSIYSKEHNGEFPSSLRELVPKYLNSIPHCPYANKDTYSKTYDADKLPQKGMFGCTLKGHNKIIVPVESK